MERGSGSIDISSMQLAPLGPLEVGSQPLSPLQITLIAQSSQPSPASLQRDFSSDRHIKAIQCAFIRSASVSASLPRKKSNSQLYPSASQPNSNTLPSTVPDSQDLANVEVALKELAEKPVKGDEQVANMNSQGSASHGTQVLSQSVFDRYIEKSRSEKESAQSRENTGGTQRTLAEGDDGHVDLTSSFVINDGAIEEPESEPVDFMPTQSQHQLSQFPESQRFKTPATVGKKRTYNGEIIESPLLKRNPLERSDRPTLGKTLGLSQAFAATQAGSSPFLDSLPPMLPSDLPSPNIDLQVRPVTASSSPLKPIIDVGRATRATTEPAARYVSMKQSQADRAAKLKALQEEEVTEDYDEDFDEEPSWVTRQRRKRIADQKAQEQLQLVATSDSSSIIRRKGRRRSRSGVRQTSEESSPPTGRYNSFPRSLKSQSPCGPHSGLPRETSVALGRDNQFMAPTSPNDLSEGVHDSEQETDHEDQGDAAERRLSQLSQTEEDKENFIRQEVQIPRTSARLQRMLTGPPQTQPSPSTRHDANGMPDNNLITRSSQAIAVADSQPSQSRSKSMKQVPQGDVTTDATEFVPQSLTPARRSPESSPMMVNDVSMAAMRDAPQHSFPALARIQRTGIGSDVPQVNETNDSDEDDHNQGDLNIDKNRTQQQNAVLETSSTNIDGSGVKDPFQIELTGHQTTATIRAIPVFDTANTHQHPDEALSARPSELSSPPIVVTPPGRKRQRMAMAEIAAEPSPLRNSVQFDERAAIGLDAVAQVMDNETPSPQRVYGRTPKRRRICQSSLFQSPEVVALLKPAEVSHSLQDVDVVDAQAEPVSSPSPRYQRSEQDLLPTKRGSTGSRSHRQVSRLTTAAKSGTTGTTSRRMTWDLEASPPRTSTPVPRPRLVATNNTSGNCRKSSRRDPDKQVTISRSDSRQDTRKDDSPDPIALPVPAASDLSSAIPSVTAPNMVLACFNGKTRAYYPALCLGLAGMEPKRYRVQWSGYEPDEVDAYGVRRLDLHEGDAVKVDLEGFPKVSYIVRGFKDKIEGPERDSMITDIRGYKTVMVSAKQRKSLPADFTADSGKEVPISAIYLDNNMWGQMRNRTYEHDASFQPAPSAGCATPVEASSTPSTPTSKSRRVLTALSVAKQCTPFGMFANMAFAISYEDPSRKIELADLICNNGGMVFTDSFHELLEGDQLSLRPRHANLGFTALLTDRHSRKVKYMQALALGLPCLSGRFIEASLKAESLVDWQSYLLPAGESAALEGATRSRIMPHVNAESVKLSDMLASRADVLSGAATIVVIGRGKAEAKRKPYAFLVQALGAGKVEKVADIKAARALIEDNEGMFELVFVDDKDVKTAQAVLRGKGKPKCRVAGNELIVQSLILGRLFDEGL